MKLLRALVWFLACALCCSTGSAQSNGDYNGDGDIDGDDFFALAGCMTGPVGDPPGADCEIFDFPLSSDGRVDLADFWAFQRVVGAEFGCTFLRKYVWVSEAGAATGCGAKITTHAVVLCGEQFSSSNQDAGSFAWVGVTKRVGANSHDWKWAQIGYRRRRINPQLPLDRRYAEIKVTLGDAIDLDQVEPWPGPPLSNHEYACYLINPTLGNWTFEFDGIPWFTSTINYPGWQNVTGTHADYHAEIWNKEDRMVGTENDKCSFTFCKAITQWGAWNPAVITVGDVNSRDRYLWDFDLGEFATVTDDFRVWDVTP